MKHRWRTLVEYDSEFKDTPYADEIDIFAYEADSFCNGPLCLTCGRTGCHHCNPQMYDEECPNG